MIKHKPATPLPWGRVGAQKTIRSFSRGHDGIVGAVPELEDARYIEHVANAYPELVKQLRIAQRQIEALDGRDESGEYGARDLLRDLGEDM